MEEILRRVLAGEPIKGMLGLGLDESDGSLHLLFQEEDSDTVYEEVMPSMMVQMAVNMLA